MHQQLQQLKGGKAAPPGLQAAPPMAKQIQQKLHESADYSDEYPALEPKSRNRVDQNKTMGSSMRKGGTARKMKQNQLGSFANPTKSWANKSMFLK